MSLRLTLRIFKGPDEAGFRTAVERTISDHGGAIVWNQPVLPGHIICRTAHRGDVHSVYLPYAGGADSLLCQKAGALVGTAWMELRIQEGSHWDYTLLRGEQVIDRFSTLPEYWDDDLEWIASQRGRPDLLSQVWGVPEARLGCYLRNWGYRQVDEETCETILKGKAYDSDRYEYGDTSQMFDFLEALGGADPNAVASAVQHSLQMPSPERLR